LLTRASWLLPLIGTLAQEYINKPRAIIKINFFNITFYFRTKFFKKGAISKKGFSFFLN
jgi:hypothetical protein